MSQTARPIRARGAVASARPRALLPVLAALALLAAACGSDPDPVHIPGTGGSGGSGGDPGTGGTGGGGTGGTGGVDDSVRWVRLTPESASVIPGEEVQLTAVATDYLDQPVEAAISWQSADPEIAAVDEDGLVRGVQEGVVTITATAMGKVGEAVITVLPVPVAQVTIAAVPNDVRGMRVGESLQLEASAFDADGEVLEGRRIVWRSSNPAVASIESSGLLLARMPGQVDVDATISGVKATETFRITIRFTTLALGSGHVCGLSELGAPFCWGDRTAIDAAADSNVAVPVKGAPKLSQIFTGQSFGGLAHSCGLTEDGAAYCWGYNHRGQLGNGKDTTSKEAVAVKGDHRFVTLALGFFHTCGVTEAGDAYCWGSNEKGQLAKLTSSYGRSIEPLLVVADKGFVELGAGGNYSCARTDGGEVWCWGTMKEGDTLAPNTLTTANPVRIGGAQTYDSLTAGGTHACVSKMGESIETYCWGDAKDGRLGNDAFVATSTPVLALTPEPLLQVAAGSTHSCGLTEAGKAYCWGSNDSESGTTFQLGLGDDDFSGFKATPTPVATTRSFSWIGTSSFSCAIGLDGLAYCWGYNYNQRLGLPVNTEFASTPALVSGQ